LTTVAVFTFSSGEQLFFTASTSRRFPLSCPDLPLLSSRTSYLSFQVHDVGTICIRVATQSSFFDSQPTFFTSCSLPPSLPLSFNILLFFSRHRRDSTCTLCSEQTFHGRTALFFLPLWLEIPLPFWFFFEFPLLS